jgi:hypothetical protein
MPGASPAGGGPNAMRVAFDYEPLERTIKSVACLNPAGKPVTTLSGSSLNGEQGGTVWLTIPKMPRINLRVVYFEKSGTITVPVRLETGVGF